MFPKVLVITSAKKIVAAVSYLPMILELLIKNEAKVWAVAEMLIIKILILEKQY